MGFKRDGWWVDLVSVIVLKNACRFVVHVNICHPFHFLVVHVNIRRPFHVCILFFNLKHVWPNFCIRQDGFEHCFKGELPPGLRRLWPCCWQACCAEDSWKWCDIRWPEGQPQSGQIFGSLKQMKEDVDTDLGGAEGRTEGCWGIQGIEGHETCRDWHRKEGHQPVWSGSCPKLGLLQIQALAMSLIGYEYQSNDIIAVRKKCHNCEVCSNMVFVWNLENAS